MQDIKPMQKETKKLISRALENSMGYREYADLVAAMASEKKTSGDIQTQEMVHYTMLNHQRMRRWERRIRLDEQEKNLLETLRTPYVWLVLTESWCGDAAPVLPVLQAMAAATPFLDLRIVFRDQNPELMDRFLTDNARSIPKLLVVRPEEDFRVAATWGPRPQEARRMVNEYKALHGKLDAEFRETLQKWYNKDKGLAIKSELKALLTLE